MRKADSLGSPTFSERFDPSPSNFTHSITLLDRKGSMKSRKPLSLPDYRRFHGPTPFTRTLLTKRVKPKPKPSRIHRLSPCPPMSPSPLTTDFYPPRSVAFPLAGCPPCFTLVDDRWIITICDSWGRASSPCQQASLFSIAPSSAGQRLEDLRAPFVSEL
jgi:hypothetical protein